ncbi:MAG: aminotransferase class V-fold PLP-dependent enzyme [Bacteroidetes bacterium]|nr:aminotransferase class V-fold PLP-dependent enzyme [Bacteroidota bacterium]
MKHKENRRKVNDMQTVIPERNEKGRGNDGNPETPEAFAELEKGVHAALETYSNVHRGSGHNSMASTFLYEEARKIVLEYLGLKHNKYVVIFCSPWRAELLRAQLEPGSYEAVSSREIGLPLGVWALAVKRKALPGGAPFPSGGGTARLISRDWVIWDRAPDKFEAGTPAIINVITFARALILIRQTGKQIFLNPVDGKLTVAEILNRDNLEEYSGRELLKKLRQNMIGRSVGVPTTEGIKAFINFDNSASTPTFTPVWDAVRQTWRQPKPVQQEIVGEVRSVIAGMLNAPPADYDILFTSNATEAINLVAGSLGSYPEQETEPVILNTFLDHSSNDLPWRLLPGCSLIRLPVDAEGLMDLEEMDKLLREYNEEYQSGKKRIRLVTVSGASNVIGTCNDLAEISRIVHRYGAQLMVDAAQLVAHRKVDVAGCGIDYLAFSAHKVYAPFGCGVLVARKDLLHFSEAELEQIRSSGEENAGGISALGKSLMLLQRVGMELIAEEEQGLTKRLLHGMEKIPGVRVYGIKDTDSPGFRRKIGVFVFNLKGMMAPGLAKELALHGIGVRFGCHCAHIMIKRLLGVGPGIERFQRILVTLFPGISLPGLTRVSLGLENTEEEVDRFIHVLGHLNRKSGSLAIKQDASSQDGSPALSRKEVKRQMKIFVKDKTREVYFKLR